MIALKGEHASDWIDFDGGRAEVGDRPHRPRIIEPRKRRGTAGPYEARTAENPPRATCCSEIFPRGCVDEGRSPTRGPSPA